MSKKSATDAYYTNPEVARWCVWRLHQVVDLTGIIVEPAAGAGAFIEGFGWRELLAFDLSPQHPLVIQDDFLLVPEITDVCHFIGNPPFGKNSSMAVRFFNHAAGMAGTQTIAFILPKTFRKESIHRRLNRNFGLVLDVDTPKNSFLLNDSPYNVPCCFQVWVRGVTPPALSTNEPWLIKTTPPMAAAAIRRVGGRAGSVLGVGPFVGEPFSRASTHYVKFSTSAPDWFKQKILTGDVPVIIERDNTAGVRSLTLQEIQKCLQDTNTASICPDK